MPRIINSLEVEGELTNSEGSNSLLYRDILHRGEYPIGITVNDVLPGGNSRDHFHPGFHVTYIISGEGVLKCGEEKHPVKQGDVIFLDENEPHCYINTGKTVFRMLGIK